MKPAKDLPPDRRAFTECYDNGYSEGYRVGFLHGVTLFYIMVLFGLLIFCGCLWIGAAS